MMKLRLFILTIILSGLVYANVAEKQVTSWLVLDALDTNYPVKGNSIFELKDILKFTHIDVTDLWPAEGDVIEWNKGRKLEWNNRTASRGNLQLDYNNKPDSPQITYAGFYLQTDRYLNLQLMVKSQHPFEIFYDGRLIDQKASQDSITTNNEKSISTRVRAEAGKHLVIVKTIKHDSQMNDWLLAATVSADHDSLANSFKLTTNPGRSISLDHILDIPLIGSTALSADGRLMAITLSQRNKELDESESWIEIRYTKDGNLFQSFRGMANISNFQWTPISHLYSFTSTQDKKTTIWVSDLNTGRRFALKIGIIDFASYRWSPDASYLVYTCSEKPDTPEHGIKKLEGMPDHWPEYRTKRSFYKLSYPSGIAEPMIGASPFTGIMDISRDGKNILLYDQHYDYQERPFSIIRLFLLDIETMKTDSIWSGRWLNSAKFSPDGQKLICLGGPSLFGGTGMNLPVDMISNMYDTQAYIFDLASGQTQAISRDFNPKIEAADWHDDGIYVIGEDKDYQHLYHYDIDQNKYYQIDTGIDVVSKMQFASHAATGIISGTSTTNPNRIAVVNLKKNSGKIIFDPAKENFKYAKPGKVKTWTFNSETGYTVDGRVYYPPDFDSAKNYPCIVYYYGGTSPVSRSFGGRYPFNYYTANGYVVYVINPAGATGYGQEVSALHVNDWGKITGVQIIEGTKKFLAAHSFVDPGRVGCMGASYGGFMTMYLVAKTDIFASAISHAGISSLSSYWGEGYWGYLYSAGATAGAFPGTVKIYMLIRVRYSWPTASIPRYYYYTVPMIPMYRPVKAGNCIPP